jgi:hypothetical protein
MEYFPGQIHESFQKTHYYLLRHDFNWLNCTKRYNTFTNTNDWEQYTETIELFEMDIIALKFFKYNQTSNTHCYLEKVIRKDGSEEIYNTETLVTLNFLEHNLDRDQSLFVSANNIMSRNNKIKQLLNEYQS